MAPRETIRSKRRRAVVGDMDKRLKLFTRSLKTAGHGQTDFDLLFDPDATVWAAITSVSGKTIFDGVAQVELDLTHEILIRYRPDVTPETWAETQDGRRLRIMAVEHVDDQRLTLRLFCADRGGKAKEATKA